MNESKLIFVAISMMDTLLDLKSRAEHGFFEFRNCHLENKDTWKHGIVYDENGEIMAMGQIDDLHHDFITSYSQEATDLIETPVVIKVMAMEDEPHDKYVRLDCKAADVSIDLDENGWQTYFSWDHI